MLLEMGGDKREVMGILFMARLGVQTSLVLADYQVPGITVYVQFQYYVITELLVPWCCSRSPPRLLARTRRRGFYEGIRVRLVSRAAEP